MLGLGPRAGGVVFIFVVGVIVMWVLDLADRFGWWTIGGAVAGVVVLSVVWDKYEEKQTWRRRGEAEPGLPPCPHGGIGAILGPVRCRKCREGMAGGPPAA